MLRRSGGDPVACERIRAVTGCWQAAGRRSGGYTLAFGHDGGDLADCLRCSVDLEGGDVLRCDADQKEEPPRAGAFFPDQAPWTRLEMQCLVGDCYFSQERLAIVDPASDDQPLYGRKRRRREQSGAADVRSMTKSLWTCWTTS